MGELFLIANSKGNVSKLKHETDCNFHTAAFLKV